MGQSPSRVALKIRCRSRRTSRSVAAQSMTSHSTAPTSLREGSSGPFTIGCLTCPSVPAVDTARPQRLTCHTSARFRVRAPGPYPTSYARRSAEAPIRCPGFLSPFGQPALASWASCSRHGLGSPYGRLTGSPQGFRTLTGFPRFPCARHGRGGRPLYPEASGVHATDKKSPVAACRSSTARPYTSVPIPSSEAHNNEASTRVQLRSPVRPSPRPRPRMERGTLRLLP